MASLRPTDLVERFGRGDLPVTLYLEGPDEGLKAALLAELRHAWSVACPEAPTARVFRAAEVEVDELLASFHGDSLFAPRELLLVLGTEDLGRSPRRLTALAEGLLRPAGGSCIALVESAAETDRKSLAPLRAACAAHCLAMPPGRSALVAWGARRLAREEVAIEPGTVEAVVDACEGDVTSLFDELEKLLVWAGRAGRIGPDDVAAILRPVFGADLPDYLAAVAAGDPALAAQRLSRLLAAGVSEGTVLFALTHLVGGALGGWSRYKDLSPVLGRRLSARALMQRLDALYRAEAAWKGGRADALAALEQATRVVAGSA